MDLHKLSKSHHTDAAADTAASNVPRPKRKMLTRIVLPTAIVLATLALIAYAARDAISPATKVQTTRAVALSIDASEAEPNQPTSDASSAVVAQAPGWVEPDPYPVYASGLANGVVKTVHVLEGHTVKIDDLLVELVADDAKLALVQANAELAKAQATLAAAKADLDEPIALRRAEAVSRAQVDARQAALLRVDAEVAKEQARLDELTAAYDRLAKLSKQSVSELNVEEAKYRALSQRAVLDATRQRRPELEAQLQTAKAEHAAAKRDLELKNQLNRVHDEAAAARDAAKAQVAEAQLRLDRMTIKSPIDGVVMARLVGPGSKVMLEMDSSHSAHVIHLYDPEQLQVRVDVPLVDAAKVGLDQRAQIVVDVLPDTVFNGRVTRLVHRADIAKNTVQFKVAITDPSPLLKPDMLARVKFYSRNGSTVGNRPSTAAPGGSPVVIKQSAVVEQDGERFVWWISPTDQRIQRRGVTLGQPRDGATVVITAGLNPGDLVVDQPAETLQENQRVRSEHRTK